MLIVINIYYSQACTPFVLWTIPRSLDHPSECASRMAPGRTTVTNACWCVSVPQLEQKTTLTTSDHLNTANTDS